MKLRLGFVSNSSTSSFLLYGTTISSYEIEEVFSSYELVDISPADEEEDAEKDQDDMEEEFYAPDFLRDLFKDSDIEIENVDGQLYIGKSWDKVRDDQTGKEFKEEIETIVNEKLGSKINNMMFCTHQEAWHD